MVKRKTKTESASAAEAEDEVSFDIFLRLGPALGAYVKEYAEEQGFISVKKGKPTAQMQDAVRAIIREHMQGAKKR